MSGRTCFEIDKADPGVWRISYGNPPINMLSPAAILELQALIATAEDEPDLKVLIFQSADEMFFISHFDTAAATPAAETPGPPPWVEVVVRLSRSRLISIAKIRGRARGVGNEFVLACDLRYASRQRAVLGNPEVGVGLPPGGGALEWLPRLVGRSRALEIVLSGDDFDADTAERWGWVNRAVDDDLLDGLVDQLATRVASFDRETLAGLKAQVNRVGLPAAAELQSSNDMFWRALNRPASQVRRGRLGPLGYGERSDFEMNFGRRLGELQPEFDGWAEPG